MSDDTTTKFQVYEVLPPNERFEGKQIVVLANINYSDEEVKVGSVLVLQKEEA